MIKIDEDFKNGLLNYKFVDLFSGIGGFHLALKSFGAKCVFALDHDKYAQSVYKDNFKITSNGDITKITPQNIPKHDILCAGFPCQAFSISGKQFGFSDTRGILFFDMLKIIKFHKPKILFLENVKNIEKHDGGNTLLTIKNLLKAEGYNVFHNILNSGDFMIPQKRERMYFVCFHKSLKTNTNFNFPKPLPKFRVVKDILEEDDNFINRDDIKLNGKSCTQKTKNTIRLGIVGKGGQGERIYSINGQAITLSAYGGGVGAKTGLYLVNNKIRKLTTRECARVMGFPDEFRMSNSKSQCYKQFGNSVVINVLQYILKEIVLYIK